jgi:hypothetical protein
VGSIPTLGTKTERETERERIKLQFAALFLLHSLSHFQSNLYTVFDFQKLEVYKKSKTFHL